TAPSVPCRAALPAHGSPTPPRTPAQPAAGATTPACRQALDHDAASIGQGSSWDQLYFAQRHSRECLVWKIVRIAYLASNASRLRHRLCKGILLQRDYLTKGYAPAV